MFNKKAQGMSTNTIILLILGLVILVVLVLGFSSGWAMFKNVASPTNVDKVADECASVCSLDQTFSFCSAERTVRINEEKLELKTTCEVLSILPQFKSYVQDCPGIQCELTCDQIVINDREGSKTLTEGYDVSSLVSDGPCFVPL